MNITRGKLTTAQKIILYGVEGIGKTTFAAAFPSPVFIDTEGSTSHIDVARMDKPTSWAMLLSQVKYVRDHPDVCRTLVIDTVDWAEHLCMADICAKAQKSGIEDFGYGKGYVYLMEEFGQFLNLLDEVIDRGIHVVMTAHATMRKVDLPEETGSYDRWELKLQKKTAPLVKEWADMVLFANYKIYVINIDNQGAQRGKNKAQGGARVMHTTHHVSWDAKNRHGLPDELPFDFAKIQHCLVSMPSGEKATPETSTTKPEQEAQPTPPPPAPQQASTEGEDAGHPERPPLPPLSPVIPKPLRDLMEAHGVAEDDIQEVVAHRGYYPRDMPIADYDQGFVDGVLIAAWEQVFETIQANRQPTPF